MAASLSPVPAAASDLTTLLCAVGSAGSVMATKVERSAKSGGRVLVRGGACFAAAPPKGVPLIACNWEQHTVRGMLAKCIWLCKPCHFSPPAAGGRRPRGRPAGAPRRRAAAVQPAPSQRRSAGARGLRPVGGPAVAARPAALWPLPGAGKADAEGHGVRRRGVSELLARALCTDAPMPIPNRVCRTGNANAAPRSRTWLHHWSAVAWHHWSAVAWQ